MKSCTFVKLYIWQKINIAYPKSPHTLLILITKSAYSRYVVLTQKDMGFFRLFYFGFFISHLTYPLPLSKKILQGPQRQLNHQS